MTSVSPCDRGRARVCATLVGLIFVGGCKVNDEDGPAGPIGTGPSSGSGQTTQCAEVVDSVAIVEGIAFTPNVLRLTDGYAVALILGGETWVVVLDDHAGVRSRQQLSNSGGTARLPTVHHVGDGLMTLWAQGSEIWTRTLDAAGAPTGTAVNVAMTASGEPRPAGASTGDALAVAWMDGASSVAGVLSGGALTQESSVPGSFPSIGAADGSVAVAWSAGADGGPISVASLTAMATPMPVAGSSSLIKAIAPAPGGFFLTWEDVGSGVEQIGLARFDLATGVVAQATASSGASANWPAVAWSGDYLAIAYYQFREQAPAVFLTFADADLAPAGNEVEIASGAKFPSLAWGNGELAVAYNREGGPVEVSVVSCP